MIFGLDGIKYNVEFLNEGNKEKPCLLFLHGFTGSTNDWKEVALQIDKNFPSLAIDLLGHGKTDSPSKISFYTAEAITHQLDTIVKEYIGEKIIPIGYSMGGRAALTYAVTYPDKIEALILESATPGIVDKKLREERITKDESIAKYILNHSMEEFTEYWMNLEIFNTQRRFSEEKRKQIKQNKMKNNPLGLANSLKGFGTGVMPHLYNQLKNVQCKTLLITGELDSKFTNINNEIVNHFTNAEYKIINNAGHNTHLEEPRKFIETLNSFLNSI